MDDEGQLTKNALKEIAEPFINFFKAPRALWAVNISYFLEGFCYFGILTLLAIYLNKNVGLDDKWAGWIVGAFTGGITLAMFFLGELADRRGIRIAFILSLSLMFIGRVALAGGNLAGGQGLGSPVLFATIIGLFLVVLGFGIYQPVCYTAVRKFTDKKTAAMGYAVLYALMNLGSFFAGLLSPRVRQGFGINGIYWVYAAFTLIGLLIVVSMLTKRMVERASQVSQSGQSAEGDGQAEKKKPFSLSRWLKEHPLRDARFTFFIFILMPVQTLFAHQWLTLPQYIDRAYPGFVSSNLETFVNVNPMLIFVFTPLIAALTSRAKVYKMMIIGTFVMAIPTFFLALGPNIIFLFSYILFMSLGESMWQPRFLQYAAELAPEGKTGQYIGIAQLPWFMTKVLTSTYSGYFLSRYCPAAGPQNTRMLWFIYGCIAIVSPIALLLARRWAGGDAGKR